MCHCWLLYDHTPTRACECLVADRHTHVVRRGCRETNENAILLTDTLKQTTYNHFKDMFLWVKTSNKRLICDWRYAICLLAGRGAIWVGELGSNRDRVAERPESINVRLTFISSPSPSPVHLWLLSTLFTLGCEDCLIMAKLSAPAPF